MRHSRFIAGLTMACALASASAHAAPAYTPLEQRLTAEQLQQTGLDQLSPAQLALLNQLLSQQHHQVVERTSREASAGRPPQRDSTPVSSRVVGSIRGWSTGTLFKLENGQSWRVLQGDLFLRKPVDNPEVNIAPNNLGSWFLQLPGQNQRAKVERVD